MTITEFLLARIGEDEAAASDPYLDAPDLGGTFGTGYDTGGADGRSARFLTISPVRVLAECEAKRRIVALHQPFQLHFTLSVKCETCAENPEADFDGTPMVDWPCPTLKALAAVYADHPDFDEAWRA